MSFPFPVDPLALLAWLAMPATWGLLITLLFERVEWFKALTSKQKKWFSFAFFIASAFLALAVVNLLVAPGTIQIPSDPRELVLWLMGVVMQGVVAWGASQYGHEADPETRRNRLAAGTVTQKVILEGSVPPAA